MYLNIWNFHIFVFWYFFTFRPFRYFRAALICSTVSTFRKLLRLQRVYEGVTWTSRLQFCHWYHWGAPPLSIYLTSHMLNKPGTKADWALVSKWIFFTNDYLGLVVSAANLFCSFTYQTTQMLVPF